jgi:hypothetical protein
MTVKKCLVKETIFSKEKKLKKRRNSVFIIGNEIWFLNVHLVS